MTMRLAKSVFLALAVLAFTVSGAMAEKVDISKLKPNIWKTYKL